MAQCTNRKELLRCSNIALNEIQTYPFNEKGLLIMKHKKVSQLLAASLSFLMIAMLCVSSVAMEPSMRIGSVTVHSSLFAKMASESPEKDLITQSNIVKATDEMIQFEEKTVLDASACVADFGGCITNVSGCISDVSICGSNAGLCGLNSVSCTVNSESCGINTPD